MELLPLLLLIPMIFMGLGLLAFGLHRLARRLRDGTPWSLRKGLDCLGAGVALLFGKGIALESLRPMLPQATGVLPRVVLVAIGGGIALLLVSRLARVRRTAAPPP